MAYEGLMVGVSGVRGRVGEALTPEVVARFAAAFGAWAAGAGATARAGARAKVVVGRDSRVSGPMFHRVVVSALQSVGCDIIDIGMVPTPTVQLAVEHHHAAGGLAITASHNPIEWNALKFIAPSGLFLDAAQGAAMRATLDGNIPRASWDGLGALTEDAEAVARHIELILGIPFLDADAIRRRRFHVALDCVRGAGAGIMPTLLERLGCRVTAINMEADGVFPRAPEPVAENLGELETLVKSCGADVGLAVDPDVDRLALVSNDGRAIGEDFTLALAARVVLQHRPGDLVTNLSTSRIMEDVAAAAGRRVLRAPVGEVNVAVRMRDEGAPIGGEGNGGVILSEVHLGRDAPIGAALVLHLLAAEGKSLSEIIGAYPKYVIVKDKLARPALPLDGVYEALREAFPDAVADSQDGLRLAWADRWVHVRPSGTEPIVRVIAEAPDEFGARHMIHEARVLLDRLTG